MITKSQSIPIHKIQSQEIRKRIYFIIKLSLFIALLYIRYAHFDFFENKYNNLIQALLFYIEAHLAISLGRIIVVYFYIKSQKLEDQHDKLVLAFNRLANLLYLAALIVTFFLLFKLKPGEILTSFSLVAVATVLLTKDYISNTVNGIILMLSDRFSLNDYVKIGNHEGRVINITLSSTYLVNNNNIFISIPNNVVYGAEVINFSKRNQGRSEVEFATNLQMLKDFARFENHLKTVLEGYGSLVTLNTARLAVKEVDVEKVRFAYLFQLKKTDKCLEEKIKTDILRSIAQYIT